MLGMRIWVHSFLYLHPKNKELKSNPGTPLFFPVSPVALFIHSLTSPSQHRTQTDAPTKPWNKLQCRSRVQTTITTATTATAKGASAPETNQQGVTALAFSYRDRPGRLVDVDYIHYRQPTETSPQLRT